MRRHTYILASSTAASFLAVATPHSVAAEPQAPVVAQELDKVRASGKVLAALWTARPDSYTLQLVLPNTTTAPLQASRIQAAQLSGMQPTLRPAVVHVWLLKADGTQIMPTRESPRPTSVGGCVRCVSYDFTYSFALEAGRQAVAAAVQINDEFTIEALNTPAPAR